MGRRVALLIATYEYRDSGLRQLTAPAHDAESLAAVLRDPDIAGFEVTTLINEPHHRVGEAIGDLYRDRRRDDLTLLYFTGHGLKDDDGRLYLATVNTRRDSLLFTSLPAEQIDQAMTDCASRQQVLILDCCYSGAFPPGRIAKGDSAVHTLERFQGRGRTVLTASDATQYSFEGDRALGSAAQSVFTRHLVNGLSDGSADLDGDGNITIDELYGYVHDKVVEEMPQQRPKKQDNVEGRIVIARNINWSLPPYMRNALESPIANDRLSAVDGLAHLYRVGNDVVREQVTAELRRLADDDSRAVQAAAAERIETLHPSAAKSPRAPAPAVVEQPAEVRGTEPSAAPATTPGKGYGARLWEDVTGLCTDVWQLILRMLGRVRNPGLAGASGVLMIAAAGLLVWSIIEEERWYDVAWYQTALASVALIAGIFALHPQTKALIGPGVVLGVVGASTWGLVVSAQIAADGVSMEWPQLTGHLAFVLAALLAGVLLYRNKAVHIELRRPGDRFTWLMAGLGGLSAAAAIYALSSALYQAARLNETHNRAELGRLAWSYAVVTVVAVLVSVWAAMTRPRAFSLSLLAGWAGGALGVVLATFQWTRGPDADITPGVVFGGALLLLVTAAIVLSRRAVTAPLVRLRRTSLITGLAVIPLLAAGGGFLVNHNAHAPVIMTRPSGVAVSPDGARLYVSTALASSNEALRNLAELPGRVSVINTATGRAIGKPIPVGHGSHLVAVSGDGSYVYVADLKAGNVSVISTLENKTVGNPIAVGNRPVGMWVTSDGHRLLVAAGGAVTSIDTATNTIVGSPITLSAPEDFTLVPSPDGRRLYLATNPGGHLSTIDAATGEVTGKQVTLGTDIDAMIISPDGRRLYAIASRGADASLLAIDSATRQQVGQAVALDNGPQFGMAINPDGRRVYVTNFFATSVSVIDTTSIAAVGTGINVGQPPTRIAVGPDGRVYVALASDGKVASFKTNDPDAVQILDLAAR